jgi:1-phosphofructokinase
MIVTVTANSTIDLTVVVPTFNMNHTMRATQTAQSMGGKPADASFILGEIGIPSLALGFAAGAIGEKVKSLLHARGVTTDFIPVGGETRINVIIIAEDGGGGSSSITTTTMDVAPEHIDMLRAKYLSALDGAECVVLGGTLPRGMKPEFYTEFIGLARDRHIPVIFDATDANLKAGLKSHPTFIKPNHDELEAFLERPIGGLEDVYRAGRDIFEQYGASSVITLGGDGALAVLPDKAYFIPPIKVDVVSPNGAGDAVLAGLAASFLQNQPVEEGLRLGIAAATAVLLQLGTADCRRADVERFLPQVELIPYPG